MPIKKRTNGSYQVFVAIPGGKPFRKSDRRWTYADAREVERRIIAQARDIAAGREPNRTIEDALERWLTDHVPRLRSSRKVINHCRMLLPYIRNRPISEIPKVWAEIKAKEQDKAPATVNHKGRILRQIGNAAWKEWGWIDRPPSIGLLPETPRERFLTLAEVDALARASGDDRVAGYIYLAAYTGIRRGHLLRLTRDDVQDGFLRVDRSSKTRGLQIVPLHRKASKIATRLPLGIGDRQLREAWQKAREATGIDCRWHDLRHTCASWLVQAGVPIYTVCEFLGHSSVATTKRYAHLAPTHLQDAIRQVQ